MAERENDDNLFRCVMRHADRRIAIEMSGEIDVAAKQKLHAELETFELQQASESVRRVLNALALEGLVR